MKGLPDQAFWTIGDGPECDIILAKANVTFGPHFSIIFDGGKYWLKDNSYISQAFEPLIRLPEKKEMPIAAGTVISLGGAVTFVLSQTTPEVKLDLLAITMKDENNKAASVAHALVEGKCSIGKPNPKKPNDIDVDNSYVSRAHCVITETHIIDSSNYGTYINPRTPIQEKHGIQSNAVAFDNESQRIAVYGYQFEFKPTAK